MPVMGEIDNAFAVWQGPSYTGDLFQAMSKVPVHGGRPETVQGLLYIGGPFYTKTAAYTYGRTNPPRNYLFADGHVQTMYRSDPVLPPQFVTRYGPKPPGFFAFSGAVQLASISNAIWMCLTNCGRFYEATICIHAG